jgi:hypothetical protein
MDKHYTIPLQIHGRYELIVFVTTNNNFVMIVGIVHYMEHIQVVQTICEPPKSDVLPFAHY